MDLGSYSISMIDWLRNIILPRPALTVQPLKTGILLAAQDAYILDPESGEQLKSFHASNDSVHSILASSQAKPEDVRFLTAARNDHFMNVFMATSTDPIGSLRSGNAVSTVDLFSDNTGGNLDQKEDELSARMVRPREAIAAVTQEGVLEIFPEPFSFEGKGSLKERMMQRTRKAAAQVRIKRPDTGSAIVPLINASFQGNDIVLAWAEGGASLMFEKVQWRNESTGSMSLEPTTDIIKAKGVGIIGSSVMNGVKDMGKTHVDESHTVVTNGYVAEDQTMEEAPADIIEISSGEEESDSEDEAPTRDAQQETNGVGNKSEEKEDTDMEDAEDQAVEPDTPKEENHQPKEDEEPSFGELLRANAAEPVDVQALTTTLPGQSLIPPQDRTVQHLPSGMSLGTVLTQSLVTNDTSLLETCFHVKDLPTVRATIERLESRFAHLLLQKLAERLHSRPGRAGSLMVWIQWTLVAHGGYLSRQPELMKQLASLHRVVQDRAKSLQSLLSLKGKLDMLEAQMNLRKSMQMQSAAANKMEEDDEEGVIYVEGQEESDSEIDGADMSATSPTLPIQAKANTQKRADSESGSLDSDDEESEADGSEEGDDGKPMPTTNGIASSSEGDDSESDEEGLFDEEAESTDNDSIDEGFEDDIDHNSVDSVESSDAEQPPPKKPAKDPRHDTNLSIPRISKSKSKSKSKP